MNRPDENDSFLSIDTDIESVDSDYTDNSSPLSDEYSTPRLSDEASPFSPRSPIFDGHCFFRVNGARVNVDTPDQDCHACQDGDAEFVAKRHSSAVTLRRLSTRYLFGGIGIVSLTAYLAFSLSVAIPPIGIAILMAVGAAMIGYAFYLEHGRAAVILQKSYSEDVEPVEARIESYWDRFCRI